MQDSLAQIEYWQQKSKKMYGENIIYAADEFYLNTDSELPNYQKYNDFPQLENGIGLTVLMNHELEKVELPESLSKVKNTAVMTSVLGKKSLSEFAEKIKKIDKLKLELKVVKNEFFGETVTVTGLLTAQDLKKNIKKINPIEYDQIFISEIVLNDQNKFLDEQTKEEFTAELSNYKIKFVSNLKELMEVIKNG
jgi:NifB/MoaA-like Fe-S oxidoreductase